MEEKIRFPELDNNHFRTPEGYFDDFTERLMAQLPQQNVNRAKVIRMRWWQSVAAVAVIVISFSTGWYMHDPVSVVVEKTPDQTEMTADMEFTDEELDAIVDYEMVQNTDITYYLMLE